VVVTIVWGQDWQKNNSKNKNRIFEKKIFKFFYNDGKEHFEKYSLNLAYAELSFSTLINYSAGMYQTYLRTTV
jgi:hypothetical protein